MAIAQFYKKSVDTKRLSDIGGGSKRQSYSTNINDLRCAIHPLSDSQQSLADGAYYQVFKMFCSASTDIKVGDRVIDGSNTYTVQSVQDYDDQTSDSTHKKIMLVLGE